MDKFLISILVSVFRSSIHFYCEPSSVYVALELVLCVAQIHCNVGS